MKYVAFSIYSQTGTGKTLAFLLPAFIHIKGQPVPLGQRGGPNVLVLAPTRELALQIAEEVEKYEYRGIKSVCVYGGGDRREQMKMITEGVEIIIATPGRLNDLVSEGEMRHPKNKVGYPWTPIMSKYFAQVMYVSPFYLLDRGRRYLCGVRDIRGAGRG